jgi:hypothetical protein
MFGRKEIEESNNFDVGDRVVIQNNLEEIDLYLENYRQEVHVVPQMKRLEGSTAIITNKIESPRKISYCIDLDGGLCVYHGMMFKGKIDENRNLLFHFT